MSEIDQSKRKFYPIPLALHAKKDDKMGILKVVFIIASSYLMMYTIS